MTALIKKSTLKLRIRYFDWILAILVLLLVIYGIVIIYSTATARVITGITKNQIIFALVGIFLFVIFSVIDYRILKSGAFYFYLLSLILLVTVLVWGRVTHGAVRWLNIAGFQLQPSEITKFFLIITLAKFFNDHQDEGIKAFLISGAYTMVPVGLVMLQPDLGTALTLLVIWLGMVLVSNLKKIYLFIFALLGTALMPFFWYFLHDYQRKRIITFLNPRSDPLGAGYNVLQSIIASGSGRLFGRGLGYGYQSQLRFLPIQHTDFIFAVLAEALGFIGASLLLILFFILLIRIARITFQAADYFGLFLGSGILAMFVFQILVNVGMNIGVMPVTGIPLPLISAGGSSLITTFMVLGIIESITLHRRKIVF